MTTPTTPAGRELLQDLIDGGWDPDAAERYILAIEAEAAPDAILREALERLVTAMYADAGERVSAREHARRVLDATPATPPASAGMPNPNCSDYPQPCMGHDEGRRWHQTI